MVLHSIFIFHLLYILKLKLNKLIYFFEFIDQYKKSMFSDSLKNKISFHLIHKLFKNTINKQKETKNKKKKETKNINFAENEPT